VPVRELVGLNVMKNQVDIFCSFPHSVFCSSL